MKSSVYVLYIQLEQKLDEKFLNLSAQFSRYGMTLIPISPEEFKELPMTDVEYVMCVVRDIASLKRYKELLKRYMNFCVRSKKVTLFELSSFEVIHDPNVIKTRMLFQERLPVSIFQIIDLIGSRIYHDRMEQSKKWPGGRRARLPDA